jgi:hypothetical protein
MSKYTRRGRRRRVTLIDGGTIDERLGLMLRALRASDTATAAWCAESAGEALEVAATFRVLGYPTRLFTGDESADDRVEAMRSGRYRVAVWVDSTVWS